MASLLVETPSSLLSFHPVVIYHYARYFFSKHGGIGLMGLSQRLSLEMFWVVLQPQLFVYSFFIILVLREETPITPGVNLDWSKPFLVVSFPTASDWWNVSIWYNSGQLDVKGRFLGRNFLWKGWECPHFPTSLCYCRRIKCLDLQPSSEASKRGQRPQPWKWENGKTASWWHRFGCQLTLELFHF